MGCASSVHVVVPWKNKKKKPHIPEIVVFVPLIRIPVQSDLRRPLKGLVPKDLSERLHLLRNQIVLVSQDTDGTATTELRQYLEDYLSLLIGLTKKEYGVERLVEFKWKSFQLVRQEICVANSWFEVLSVIYLMAMLTLAEADSLMVPKDYSVSGIKVVTSDCKREAIDLLLKASGYLEFCVREVLIHIPQDIKKRLPKDLQDNVLEAISIQALGQGTEIQLGLAAESQKATLSVKRRLACEQMSYFSQAYHCLSGGSETNPGNEKKHLWFVKWKFLEAKAAAYYYHGLILDKGSEPSSHVSAVCCFLASEEILSESKKACFSFCLAPPVTRAPPLWGAMKLLNQKIPEVASRKSQMYGYLLEQEKVFQELPDLPEFQVSLGAEEFRLPEIDLGWDRNKWEIKEQTLKEHIKEETETPPHALCTT